MQEDDGSIVVQCVYAISTDDTVQCVVVFTDVQSGYTWNTTVGHTPGTHPPMGSKVIMVPQAGVYNITVYDSVGDITVLAIVYDGTIYVNDTISTVTTTTATITASKYHTIATVMHFIVILYVCFTCSTIILYHSMYT